MDVNNKMVKTVKPAIEKMEVDDKKEAIVKTVGKKEAVAKTVGKKEAAAKKNKPKWENYIDRKKPKNRLAWYVLLYMIV